MSNPGKKSNPCAWYVGNHPFGNFNPGPFCGKQSVTFVGGKPYCKQHQGRAAQRLAEQV